MTGATSIVVVAIRASAENVEKKIRALVIAARLVGIERISVETLVATGTKRAGSSEILLVKEMPEFSGWSRYNEFESVNITLRVMRESQVAAPAFRPGP